MRGEKKRQPKPGQGSGGAQLPDIIKKSTAFDERRKKSWRKPGEKKPGGKDGKDGKKKDGKGKSGKDGKDGNGVWFWKQFDSHESNENNAKKSWKFIRRKRITRTTSR
jgi:hypothetical protein